jgi:large subunit ribosomal protein L14
MIQKTTKLIPADKCGVWVVRVFHLYRGYNRKVSFIGDFIKASVRRTRPENWLQKKTKVRGIILRTKKETFKRDGSFVKFQENSAVLLKKRMTPQGKEVIGPILYNVKRKKFVSSFSGTI